MARCCAHPFGSLHDWLIRQQRQEPYRIEQVGFPHRVRAGDTRLRSELDLEVQPVLEAIDLEASQHGAS
ncbi:MAG TPA: hypothetical protein RMH99_20955 [Sandaracinaceae bacterium LLY-WYZ-13_1]|nr:hypothetical protein [Sandaracinaceae bacterium LLY-WYZ-13_1]